MGQNENSGRSSGDHRGPGNGSGIEDRQRSGTERLSEETDIRFSAHRDNTAALREPTRTERRAWLDDYSDTASTPDDFVGELEREIIDGRASYTPLSNKAAAGYAERKLAEGMDEATAVM
ncbi:MAG: hypothetical protein E7554_04710 [Ruminococcaceae bacterium]|nr:hypothetical protein [Oscillospiraceae bacterium]